MTRVLARARARAPHRFAVAAVVVGAAASLAVACSLVQNADDIVVGNGQTDGGAPNDARDDGAATSDATNDGADAARDGGSTNLDPRWANWRMPSNTPTAYDDGGAAGIVVDRVTGIEWQRAVGGATTFDAAVLDCTALDLAGRGWRLPTRIELVSLLTYGRGIIPAINQSAFPGTPAAPFWTSSTLGTGGRYVVDFGPGTIGTAVGTELYQHRCVRSHG